MSFSIVYKRLFEVEIRHGFFLNLGSRREDYALANEERYDAGRLFSILPDGPTAVLLRNFKMVFRPTPRGFMVALRTRPDGAAFRPVVDLPASFSLSFRLRIRNGMVPAITNLRIQPGTPAICYFSNFEGLSDLRFPSLCRLPQSYSSGRAYEMGEIVGHNDAAFMATLPEQEDRAPGAAGASWVEVADLTDPATVCFATDRDRLLLPPRFEYRFSPVVGAEVREGVLRLRSLADASLRELPFDSPAPLSRIAVDFEDPIPAGWYDLEVDSTTGYADAQRVLIDDALFANDLFGVVRIGHATGLGDFSLLDAEGRLPAGGHPVFQVRLRNRYTYWRYAVAEGQTLPDLQGSADVRFLDAERRQLITKKPLPLTASLTPVFLQKDIVGTPEVDERVALPNPEPDSVKLDAEGRQVSEVFLSQLLIG